MKKILLIETKLTNSQAPEDFKLNYRKEFLRLVELMPDGVTASQMGAAIKIAEKLKGTEDGHWLLLEDAECDYLKTKLTAARWNFAAPEIVAMVEAVEKAETCEAPHLKGEKTKQKEASAA